MLPEEDLVDDNPFMIAHQHFHLWSPCDNYNIIIYNLQILHSKNIFLSFEMRHNGRCMVIFYIEFLHAWITPKSMIIIEVAFYQAITVVIIWYITEKWHH